MKTTRNFLSPMTGKIMDISTVPDAVFSDRIMGDGFAVELDGKNIVAPVDGVVASVFPGGHAVCMVTDSNCQILIHIGLETHCMDDVYEIHVRDGQRVRAGELLIRADYRRIRRNKNAAISPVVFLGGEKIKLLKENQRVWAGENDIIEIVRAENIKGNTEGSGSTL